MMKRIMLLIILCMLFAGCSNTTARTPEDIRINDCYKEAVRIWNSVNNNYPNNMTINEAYDKNTIQAIASMSYISCIHGGNMNLGEHTTDIIYINRTGDVFR